MKIELEEPFKSKWRKGYLRTSKNDERSRVDLFNSDKDRTTITYAKYLKSVELGKEIPLGFEVDHKDNDKTNDDPINLQILSTDDHIKKTKIEQSGCSMTTLKCSHCNEDFERETRFVNSHSSNLNFFCSRSCNARFYFPLGPNKL